MTFKEGQKVRLKGTDIEGEVYRHHADGIVNVEVDKGTNSYGERDYYDYYLPAELVEAVAEPITVTFDKVDLPVTAENIFNDSRITVKNAGAHVALDAGNFNGGRLMSFSEARKLAYAILTVTEA